MLQYYTAKSVKYAHRRGGGGDDVSDDRSSSGGGGGTRSRRGGIASNAVLSDVCSDSTEGEERHKFEDKRELLETKILELEVQNHALIRDKKAVQDAYACVEQEATVLRRRIQHM
jgi:hypothetical protein